MVVVVRMLVVGLALLAVASCKESECAQSPTEGDVDGCSADTDCANGESCEVVEGCVSSSCTCSDGIETCTADCRVRHACQARDACPAPSPSGKACLDDTSCDAGESCRPVDTSAPQVTFYRCDAASGRWVEHGDAIKSCVPAP